MQVLKPSIERNIKAKIESAGTPLKDWEVSIYRGIITGYNNAFLIDNQTKEILIDAHPESKVIHPITFGIVPTMQRLRSRKSFILKQLTPLTFSTMMDSIL